MLLNNNAWIIFRVFALEPMKNFYLRELAKQTKLSTTAVKHQLELLLKEEVIITDASTLYQTYKTNWGHKNYHYYKKILNKHLLTTSGLITFLEEKTTPDCIILFGSYEKGEDRETSDIDLYIQGTDRKISVKNYETELKRKIQLIFAESLQELPQEVRNNIINGSIMSGFVHDTDTHNAGQRTSKKYL